MKDIGATFEASAFHPSLGSEVAVGAVSIDQYDFHFQSEAVNIDIPLVRLKARFGDGDDDRIFFRDSKAPEWEIYTSDDSILEHLHLKNGSTVVDQLTNVASKQELWRRLRILGYVVGTCVLLIWLGQVAISAMVRSLVAKVPLEAEQEIGDGILKEVRGEMVFIEDSNRVANLTALAQPLINSINTKTKFTFFLAESEDPNAFAMPGGYVVVTTGLLERAERPEEVLGVLSHEIAHVTEKHGIRSAISAVGPFLIFRVFLGGGGGGVGELAAGASDFLVRQSFSQEYETEADEVGWKTLVAAKIDPRGMTEMFYRLKKFEDGQKTGMELPQAFQSHPALEKRIARLEKKWRKLDKNQKFVDLSSEAAAMKVAAGKN